jgi:hypothetical protein
LETLQMAGPLRSADIAPLREPPSLIVRALGAHDHWRHFERGPMTSGLSRSADILRVRRHVSKVPTGDMLKRQLSLTLSTRHCSDIFIGSSLALTRAREKIRGLTCLSDILPTGFPWSRHHQGQRRIDGRCRRRRAGRPCVRSVRAHPWRGSRADRRQPGPARSRHASRRLG